MRPSFEIGGVRIDVLGLQEAVSVILHGQGPMSVHLCNSYTVALADSDAEFRGVINGGTLNLPRRIPGCMGGTKSREGHLERTGPRP